MKMTVVTTVTSTFDIGNKTVEHGVDIHDQDGLSNVSYPVFGALVRGGVKSALLSVEAKFPGEEAMTTDIAIEAGHTDD